MALSKKHKASLTTAELRRLLGPVDRIGVIVTVDDPTEQANKNANYTLRVNGVLQPGGRGSTVLATDQVPLSKRLKITVS